MKLYLSSYKLGKDVSFIQNWMHDNGNKILVIPNALDDIEDKNEKNNIIKERCLDLETLGFELEILDLVDYFDKDIKDALKNQKTFYVLGGNVFILNRAMILSGFDEFLKSKIDDDSILYAGFSAGICVLANHLDGLDLVVDSKIDPYKSNIDTIKGIGILDYLPVPHYKSNHKASLLIDKVVEYLDKNNIKYRTLKDGEVIVESTKNSNIKKLV